MSEETISSSQETTGQVPSQVQAGQSGQVTSAEEILKAAQLEIKNDLSVFRKPIVEQVAISDKDALDEVIKDAEEYYINGKKANKSLYEFVEEFQHSQRKPYSVEYFGLKDFFNEKTSEDFEDVDGYILQSLKKANQVSSLDAYNKLLSKIESMIGLTEDSEPFHRLDEILKFIRSGKQK